MQSIVTEPLSHMTVWAGRGETSQLPQETPQPMLGGELPWERTVKGGRDFFKELFLSVLTCWPFLDSIWTQFHLPQDMQCCTMHGLLIWLDGKS